ncbi:hypothetical protein AYO40_02020 [Planctomycetaceae bacterium SCGC AG-212-D15]|nr:hypothetical protein AYO40_02020 [Planctomycetaceae bacterium SCGC AG-212-D15]
MRRVLLTGASGFVGANLARRLLRDGHEVQLLLGRQTRMWRLADIQSDVQCHEADLRDASAVQKVVSEARPDWVFHLAVHGGYSWQKRVEPIVETNVLGTVNLLQACIPIGFEAFVNAGSSSEYGWKDHAPAETDCLEPNSCYGVTKAFGSMLCRQTAHATSAPITTLRLYSVYGPYEEPHRLMPSLVLHGLRGHYPPLANPNVSHDFVHIDDVVEAFVLAATHRPREPGAIYNVGTGCQQSLRQVVELAATLFDYRELPNWGSMPNRSWDGPVWVADNTKIRHELNWHVRHPLPTGMRALAAWFRENPTLRAQYCAALQLPNVA